MFEIVWISLFIVIFGIFYLHYSTRNRERMALIEKGADASIFVSQRTNREAAPVWKILLLNLGLLAMGIGLGLILSIIISRTLGNGYMDGPLTFACIFTMGGLSLIIGFFLTRKLIK